MNRKELEILLNHFSEEKEYIVDGYYRLRKKAENTYEIAFLVAGHCGTTNYHPQITLEIEGERILPVLLLDTETTPIRRVEQSETTTTELEEALVSLTKKFLHAKQLSVV